MIAASVRMDRWTSLTRAEREGYAPLVPDVCIEVLSKSDSVAATKHKLLRYRNYGAAFVVLIDPFDRLVWTDGTPPADDFPTDFSPTFDVA